MPSFKIYGSVAGFYDYGPPGCAVKQYITQYWRQHFVLEEDMLQVLHSMPLKESPQQDQDVDKQKAHKLVCVNVAASQSCQAEYVQRCFVQS